MADAAPPPLDVDPDIAAATPEQVNKLRLQEYRNEVADKKAASEKLAADTANGYAGLDDAETVTFKRELMLMCAEKFFTPGVEKDPLLVQADAVADVARAKAHYDEFCRVFGIS